MISSYVRTMASICSLLCISCQSEFPGPNQPPIAIGGLDQVIDLGKTDQIFCNGTSECDGHGHCEPTNISPCNEEECSHCQEADQSCQDPVGTPCPDDKFCNGVEKCNSLGICIPGQNPCPQIQCQQCQEDMDSCFDPPGTPCEDDAFCTVNTNCLQGQCQGGEPNCVDWVDECNLAYCDEKRNRCERVPVEEGTLCFGSDGEPCNSACDKKGKCIEDVLADDLSPCLDDNGICCDGICHVGYSCCSQDDCDDRNSCTSNHCRKGNCVFDCADDSCFFLDMETNLTSGQKQSIRIHTCKTDLDPSSFACVSSRNQRYVFLDDFEKDLDRYVISGDVSQHRAAQNPGSSGALGVRLCQPEAQLMLSVAGRGFDAREQIELSFWARSHSLTNNRLLSVEYFAGQHWSMLLLLGDDPYQADSHYRMLLPEAGLGRDEIVVRFRIVGENDQGDEDNCAYLDDLALRRQLAFINQETLVQAQRYAGDPGPFRIVDPHLIGIDRRNRFGIEYLDRKHNRNVTVVSADIDTTGFLNQDQLLVQYAWSENTHLAKGDYCHAEYSLDPNPMPSAQLCVPI